MRVALLIALGLLLALPSAALATGNATDLRIKGNQFLDEDGDPFRPLGVNLSSAEFSCVEPTYGNDFRTSTGVWALPTDAAAIAAMASWHMNAVRIPLNEDCWLGINAVKRTEDSVTRLHGAAARKAGRALKRRYRRQITTVVNRIHAHGMVVILDLHW